jgi:hypothetical protein
MEPDRGLEVLAVAMPTPSARIAWMRQLMPSAPALVTR